LPFVRARLVGGDVQTLVHLAGIGHDDLAVEVQRKGEREGRLADAGGPDDDWNAESGRQ
jgi:hypothetical protein